MTTSIPVTTLSNLRQNLVPPSLLDLLYIQQGSEHDRDSAITLGQLLGTQVIQSFLNDRDNWRTFTPSKAGIITLGDYQRNVIIVPSAKDQALRIDHFPTNGLIIYAPDWDAENAVTGITIGEINDINRKITITKGGIGIFYSFGPDQPIIGQSLIGSSDLSLAVLKKLNVDNLIVKSELTLPALSILSQYIATRAVTADKIANGAVTIDKIGNGAVTSEKISQGAVTTDKISTYAVETIKIKDKAVTSGKLADMLTFVKRPLLPPNILYIQEVTSKIYYEIVTSYNGVPQKGIIFHNTDVPIPGWGIKLHITDADINVGNGVIYRIYNNTFNDVNVRDYTTDTFYTRILAWSFKDFYHLNGWRMD